MKTGVQVKTASFPPPLRWKQDLNHLKSCGITQVSITIPWFLAEVCPSRFQFSLFEEQLDSASKAGLQWMITPDPILIPAWYDDSSCIDSESFRSRFLAFFQALTDEYGKDRSLHGWNLAKISIAPCRCSVSKELFCRFLSSQFSSVELLNEKWHRNYFSFENVPMETPERFHDVAETMEFLKFQRMREEIFFEEMIRILRNGSHPETEILLPPRMKEICSGWKASICVSLEENASESEQTLALASVSDSFGEIPFRIMQTSSSLSRMTPEVLLPSYLYRFLWNAAAYGAEEIVLGEWDPDSAGNLLTSDDFYFEERLEKIRQFGKKTDEFQSLLKGWVPDSGDVAVFRSRISERFLQTSGIYLKQAHASLFGWIRSLAESSTPFSLCDEDIPSSLDGKKLLILPGTPVISKNAAAMILDFVHRGGTLVCEPECGAWSSTGVALRPDSRFIAEAVGVCEMARIVDSAGILRFKYGKHSISLDAGNIFVPLKTVKKYTEVLVPYRENSALAERIVYGKGEILLLGAFVGQAASRERSPGLEAFLNALLNRVSPEYNLLTKSCRVIPGHSGRSRLLFLFAEEHAGKIEIGFDKSFWKTHILSDLISGKRIRVSAEGVRRTVKFIPDSSGIAVLCEELKKE